MCIPSGPASCTATIGFSFDGLIVSKVFSSFPFTHLPSMYKPMGCSYVRDGVSIFAVSDIIATIFGSNRKGLLMVEVYKMSLGIFAKR